uniref:Uncharacterized protein n=1 Tax=Acrobeloides nanus TaxID=290746 RepID=A0A914DYY8_9BILA
MWICMAEELMIMTQDAVGMIIVQVVAMIWEDMETGTAVVEEAGVVDAIMALEDVIMAEEMVDAMVAVEEAGIEDAIVAVEDVIMAEKVVDAMMADEALVVEEANNIENRPTN